MDHYTTSSWCLLGVAYCHAKGVMHKDLKLENIMLASVDPPEALQSQALHYIYDYCHHYIAIRYTIVIFLLI